MKIPMVVHGIRKKIFFNSKKKKKKLAGLER